MHPAHRHRFVFGAFLALIALALLFGIVRCGASDGEHQGAKALAAKAASYKGFAGRSPLTTTTEAPIVVTESAGPAANIPANIPAGIPTVPPAERPQSFTDSGFPADCIGHYESGNDYGEAGGGRFQIIHSTWAGYDGYADAEDAPAPVQDARAAELWAENGHAHWAAQRGRCF